MRVNAKLGWIQPAISIPVSRVELFGVAHALQNILRQLQLCWSPGHTRTQAGGGAADRLQEKMERKKYQPSPPPPPSGEVGSNQQ